MRRILEEHAWKSRSSQRKSSNCSLTNYNIVASRGELARGSFSVSESGVRRGKSLVYDNSVDCREEIGPIGRESSGNNWEKRRDYDRDGSRVRSVNKSIPKSPSLPTNLKDGEFLGLKITFVTFLVDPHGKICVNYVQKYINYIETYPLI